MKGWIDVSYRGEHAKMINIFFGDVLLELDDGEKIVVHESNLDKDWRSP